MGVAGSPAYNDDGTKENLIAKTAPIEAVPPDTVMLPGQAVEISLQGGVNVKASGRFAEIVIDATTGEVLSQKNADTRLYPASLTKMMTLYLTFEALSQGKLELSQNLPVSKEAAVQEPSELGLKAKDSICVEDAVLGITTKSANDCAVVLSEADGGSEESFARAMNIKARQLGMNNTNFVNASGLPDKAQFSTARDMATLSRALLRDFPQYYHYFSVKSFTYRGHTDPSHNKLMGSYPGMDGIKTGYIDASGFNLAASAVHDSTRLIGVVFGGRTARSRDITMAKLLDQGFASVRKNRVAALAEKKPGAAPPREDINRRVARAR
ncbi:MAG: serine hydrolase [Alphaproteobacteria bacterium]|nr:serine hydrolase [Alphaproteobacteria bacterium]